MQSPPETSTTSEDHLSYPVASSSKQPSPPPPTTSQPRPLLKDRLYVGNLHPSVDEYTLVQMFSKYGTISKLDYLFHKAGPMKGKPRGYAFIEYSNQDDAARALAMANDKLVRSRKLVVTYAHQAPPDHAAPFSGRHKRMINDTGKPTTLSLLKSVATGRADATGDKIAKMEAKLRQLEQAPSSTLVGHPSLPPKPTGMAASADERGNGRTRAQHARNSMPLPSLPMAPLRPTASSSSVPTQHLPPTHARRGTSSLLGVKIKKHKET